jgi:hypothetical protein
MRADEPPPALPAISLPPMMSPRADGSFDKDGLPQFPPNSPHGLPSSTCRSIFCSLFLILFD